MAYISIELIIAILATALISFMTYFTLKIYEIRKRYSHIPGPPTKGILGFYLGNAIELVENEKKKRVAADLVLDWIKTYGTTIKYQMMSTIIVVTVDKYAIKEAILERDFPKPPLLYGISAYIFDERFLGRGLVHETDSSRWRHRRALFNPAFHKQILTNFMNDFNHKSDLLLEKLVKSSDGTTVVSMLQEFSSCALDIIAQVAFGMETDSLNDPNNELNRYVTAALVGFQKHSENELLFFPRFYPSNIKFKYFCKPLIRKLRQMGKDQIMNRIEMLKDGSYIPSDLLSITLKESQLEPSDLEDMIDEFITFFMAGQETTANTLSFCLIEIAKNPLILKKLREEIDSVLGNRNVITIDDLNKLEYLSCIIKETLRKWPPANLPMRQVNTNEFKINGISIPYGALLHVPPYVCGKYEGNFSEPLEFKPERFMTKNNEITAYSYFPFSLGPRNCIGQNFAKIEMKVILTKLVKNFDFRLKDAQELGPVEYGTFRPIDGALCYISPRIV